MFSLFKLTYISKEHFFFSSGVVYVNLYLVTHQCKLFHFLYNQADKCSYMSLQCWCNKHWCHSR